MDPIAAFPTQAALIPPPVASTSAEAYVPSERPAPAPAPAGPAPSATLSGPGLGLEPGGAGKIKSSRPYRSRRVRPCDRCRSRKQRCVVPEHQTQCLNCELAGAGECSFNLPSEPRIRPSKTLGLGAPTSAIAEALEWDFDERGQIEIHTQPQTQQTQQQPISQTSPALSNPASVTKSRVSSLADLLLPVTTHVGVAVASREGSNDSSEEYQSLDLAANDNEELSIVGTASETDALQLGLLVSDSALDAVELGRDLPGVKIRSVSSETESAVAFIYHPARPYVLSAEQDDPLDRVTALVGADNVPMLMANYLKFEGQAVPIWSSDHFSRENRLDSILHCTYITIGLNYHPPLRHLYHQAWSIIISSTEGRKPRARLSSIQAALIDLNAPCGINPASNFILLGQTIAVAKLLGLHRDCTTWKIPMWEKDLRSRIWWALVQYDIGSALSFGRTTLIGSDWDGPLPRRSVEDSKSYDSFVSLAELSIIQNDFLQIVSPTGPGWARVRRGGTEARRSKLSELAAIAVELDFFRKQLDARSFFERSGEISPPGVCSLELMYLGTSVCLTRAVWGAVVEESAEVKERVEMAQRACLQASTELVEFVVGLSWTDLTGYWPVFTPYLLSTTMVTLVRLTLQSDRTAQQDDAVWQLAVFTLRRFLSTLSTARQDAAWDPADLALSRAHYFVPLLARQAPEFAVVLEPLQMTMPELSVDDQLEALLSSFIGSNNPFAPFEGPPYA